MKTCTKCGEAKPLDSYNKRTYKSGTVGYHSWCKRCTQTLSNRWAKQNKEKMRGYVNDWQKKNREYDAARKAARRGKKAKRTPEWLTDDHHWMMQEIYDLRKLRSEVTGVEHHVDHIVPLMGKNVSGLHVPWNLQVIPASENCRKSNRYE